MASGSEDVHQAGGSGVHPVEELGVGAFVHRRIVGAAEAKVVCIRVVVEILLNVEDAVVPLLLPDVVVDRRVIRRKDDFDGRPSVLEIGHQDLELRTIALVDLGKRPQRIQGRRRMDVPRRPGVNFLLSDVPGCCGIALRAVRPLHARLSGLPIREYAQPLANIALKLRDLPDRRAQVVEREKLR